MNNRLFDILVILGPTASGKTQFAAHLASHFNGEIISADSRQVYRGMDIGTGKDYDDYIVDGSTIPYHLVDIVDAGYKYNVYEFQKDFLKVYNDIIKRNKLPILCGGSGMYIESITKGYKLIHVPRNEKLRKELNNKSMDELIRLLSSYKNFHNTTDTVNRKRITRAIEIEVYYKENSGTDHEFPTINPLYLGVKYDRQSQRKRISSRLTQRLKAGMIEEVVTLLKELSPDQLIYYGLEYKYLTQYLTDQISYEEMFRKLETAIHQFAKRQMTWFRKMEREGVRIHWFDGHQPLKEKINRAMEIIITSNH